MAAAKQPGGDCSAEETIRAQRVAPGIVDHDAQVDDRFRPYSIVGGAVTVMDSGELTHQGGIAGEMLVEAGVMATVQGIGKGKAVNWSGRPLVYGVIKRLIENLPCSSEL